MREPDKRAAEVITKLLAAHDYNSVEQLTGGRRLSATDLARAVRDYGPSLVPLPPEALDDLDVVAVDGSDPPTYSVVVDLWTREEGHSDLTLELQLVDRYGGAYDVSIMDLHVL